MKRKYWTLGEKLPHLLSTPLFGDRKKYGKNPPVNDAEWAKWQAFYMEFYLKMQKNGIGKTVNDAGYRILENFDLNGRRVFELGPGTLPHAAWWKGRPESYTIADVSGEMLEASRQALANLGVPKIATHLLEASAGGVLPLEDGCCDTVLTFYSLEHLHPLAAHLDELCRILKPGGMLVGAIPSEGGLGWGLGRFLTSRRFLKKEGRLDPDKIICWEHPNFVSEILNELDRRFEIVELKHWPLRLPFPDFNLVISFTMRKK